MHWNLEAEANTSNLFALIHLAKSTSQMCQDMTTVNHTIDSYNDLDT